MRIGGGPLQPRQAVAGLLLAAAAGLAAGAAPPPGRARAILLNVTPSEPLGLYVRTGLAPHTGRLAAFFAPPAAFPYADHALGDLRRVPVLKTLAAGPGDRVCAADGQLLINGRRRAPIAPRDGQGRALPQWRACRRLGDGEYFALSTRVPNSFDSRYYGPVPARAILGVFRPLLAAPERR
jgi:conjugative transfer signal peptidase TraF